MCVIVSVMYGRVLYFIHVIIIGHNDTPRNHQVVGENMLRKNKFQVISTLNPFKYKNTLVCMV